VAFVLAHLSDAHLGPLPHAPLRELLNKRLTGYMNWHRGRGAMHNMDVLRALVADMIAQQPDHIAMTGDVLNIGLRAEFPRARQWLHSLGRPADVSFVPGNHDAYVRASMADIATYFAPWCCDDDSDMHFPYLRHRGDVALIGVSSAVPTAPLLASGRVGADQCAQLAVRLDEARAQNVCRVVMIHHSPMRGGAHFGRGLSDARLFEAVIAAHGAELIIHGHNHRSSLAHIAGPQGRVPVVGVASASAVPGTERHRAGYHLIRIERAHGAGHDKNHAGWQINIQRRGLMAGAPAVAAATIGPLGQLMI
jgi:3',5'-cyclic AMP phosphodiesterase CpdA